jgi:serine/threonine-protein kinase
MSPEQASGRAVDARTDVYAFGLLLYDMLLGRQRLAGREALSELLSRTTNPPPAPSALGAAMPEATEAVIMRCVQPDPDERFASGQELVKALDGLLPDGRLRPVLRPAGAPPAAAKAASRNLLARPGRSSSRWRSSRLCSWRATSWRRPGPLTPRC